MTLDRDHGHNPGDVKLVECPFCGADLTPDDERGRGTLPARHLGECNAFETSLRDQEGDA